MPLIARVVTVSGSSFPLSDSSQSEDDNTSEMDVLPWRSGLIRPTRISSAPVDWAVREEEGGRIFFVCTWGDLGWDFEGQIASCRQFRLGEWERTCQHRIQDDTTRPIVEGVRQFIIVWWRVQKRPSDHLGRKGRENERIQSHKHTFSSESQHTWRCSPGLTMWEKPKSMSFKRLSFSRIRIFSGLRSP
jgi:hypothetical protein